MAALAACAAQTPPLAPASIAVTQTSKPSVAGKFGTIRIAIDPEVGDQEQLIREKLAKFPFVEIGEPADYLATTKADFPLDLELVDAHQAPVFWDPSGEQHLVTGNPAESYLIGNLADPKTDDRLAAMLSAAARIRAVAERSQADMLGIDVCVVVSGDASGFDGDRPPECIPIDLLTGNTILFSDWVSTIRVRNSADSDRYVAATAASDTLKFGWFGKLENPRSRKLAPGESAEFGKLSVFSVVDDNPRMFIMVSRHPFDLDQLDQPSPLETDIDCRATPLPSSCAPKLGGAMVNDDLAVRSIQLYYMDEPMPAMGNGSDATAEAAVWMAQFYSILPYTEDEIAADAKLPDDERQFLRERTYEERQHRCGASLVAKDLLITAAHCVAKGKYAGAGLAKVMKERRIRLGSLELGEGGNTYAITAVAVHPGYDPDHQNHDIAMMLIKPDRGSKGPGPAGILDVAEHPLAGGISAYAFGWGLTGSVSPEGNIMMTVDRRIQRGAGVLQYGELRSVSLASCKKKLADQVQPGMVCMYSKEALSGRQSSDGVFTCRGDSGGPLVQDTGRRTVLVGLVSWSKGCGYKNYPSVFTDVGSYWDWIVAAARALRPGMAIRPQDPARPTLGASRSRN